MLNFCTATMHLQKHSHDYDSVANIADANDSGFSEICHTCEREDVATISSHTSCNRAAVDGTFNKVSIQCSSTPKRSSADYLYQQMALSSGLQECTAETMAPFAKMPKIAGSISYTQSVAPPNIKTEVQFEGNTWSNSQPKEQPALYHQQEWPTDRCVGYQPRPYISEGSRQTTLLADGNVCKDFQSDRKQNILGPVMPNLLKGNPLKIEFGTTDTIHSTKSVQKCTEMTSYAGLLNNSELKVGGITANKTPSKLADMLFNNKPVKPVTLPLLDVKSNTPQVIGHVLKSPPFIRPMTMSLPQCMSFSSTNIAVQTLDLSYFSTGPNTAPSMPDSLRNTNSLTYSALQQPKVLPLNNYNSRRSMQYVISPPKAGFCLPYPSSKVQIPSRFASEFEVNFNIKKEPNDVAYRPAASHITDKHCRDDTTHLLDIPTFGTSPVLSGETGFKSNNLDRNDSFTFQRSTKCVPSAFLPDFRGKSLRGRQDMGTPADAFALHYSDISTEDSHTDSPVPSESSCDEASRDTPVYVLRKNKKLKRKSQTPRRSPDKRDPRFKGVTIWLQTEFKNGKSHLHLSAFYSNVKTGITNPGSGLSKTKIIHSDSEAEAYYPPTPIRESYGTSKTCASCRTRRTPLWRDAEDGTPLCNACGIRYKKYRLRCSRCWFIPKKDIKTYPNCPACGSALRYSFHRKSW